MIQSQKYISRVQKITLSLVLIFSSIISNAQQRISFGIHADPLISWFSTDINEVRTDGARAGFNLD